MRAVLLAAGFATRLHPFTRECPKPLLPVAGVPLLDYILAKVFEIPNLDGITLVSNHRFAGHFANWLQWRQPPGPIALLDDGTTDNENRRGAIADLALALDQTPSDGPLLVLATDNLFDFSLADFVGYAQQRSADAVVLVRQPDLEARRRTGIAELDHDDRLIGFEEKPREPKTEWRVPPFYCFRQETLPEIGRYLEQGNNPDAPGNLIAWLHKRCPVYGYKVAGDVLDIGNPENYMAANRDLRPEQLERLGNRPW